MDLSLEQALGQKLMLSFAGTQLSTDARKTLQHRHVGGITLFRSLNVDTPAQVRALAEALQQAAAASGQPPLLIAANQEGGQLMTIGEGATPFPGNMALGATGSTELAYKTGHAIGQELAAMGVNVNYAPDCDVNVNPENPVIGTRSFGEDPSLVARLSAAMVEGIQSAGVAATAKHFPGHGDTVTDSHHGTPVLLHDKERLRRVELPPFVAAVQAGVRLMMTAHVALPAFNDGLNLPSTLSPAILRGLLRQELGFDGVITTDAMEMQAIRQGPGLGIDAIAAVAAGADLLLLNANLTDQENVYASLLQAAQRGLVSQAEIVTSARRVLELKQWLARAAQPALDVVGCTEHRDLAYEIAARSVTLVRDDAHILPLRLDPDKRIAAIAPQPLDLTPADTSSYITPILAEALRTHHSAVDEFLVPHTPTDADIAALRQKAGDYDLIVVGTINAFSQPGQAALVNALLQCGIPTIAVALRMPYDLRAYPTAPTYICTYSIQSPTMTALAQALWGLVSFAGQLPVSIPGI